MPRTASIARSASVSNRSSRKSAIGLGQHPQQRPRMRLVQAPEVHPQAQRRQHVARARRADGSGGVMAISRDSTPDSVRTSASKPTHAAASRRETAASSRAVRAGRPRA